MDAEYELIVNRSTIARLQQELDMKDTHLKSYGETDRGDKKAAPIHPSDLTKEVKKMAIVDEIRIREIEEGMKK